MVNGRKPDMSRHIQITPLLLALVACNADSQAQETRPPPATASGVMPTAPGAVVPETGATPPVASPHPMMPGRIYAPSTEEIACPSQAFEPFLHAFLNSGDLQVRYSARPTTHKLPYYDHHNTQPGDPANPQWAEYEDDRPMHDGYRYDARLDAYIWDSSRLRPGQIWTGTDADGKHVARPITELQVRKVSDTEYALDTPGRVTTFSKRADCWYLTHDWSLDAFEGCQWPDQCLAMREYEAPYFDDASDPGRVEARVGTMMQVIEIPRKRDDRSRTPAHSSGARTPPVQTPAVRDDRSVDVPAPVAGVIGARDDDSGRVDILDRNSGALVARFLNMSDIAVEVGDRVDYGQRLGSHRTVESDPVFLRLEMDGADYPKFRRYADDLLDDQGWPFTR